MEKNSAVALLEISKSFGDCVANSSVSLSVEAGSIHAIVGENGAGKSTAMKMLYGQYAPDSGKILVDGLERHWASPADAIGAGLGMVHQHFMLAETHSALENILLGTHGWPFSPMGKKNARAKLQKVMAEFGLDVPLDKPVSSLPVGVQQRIEILKLLFRDSRILILDEPTAVLAPSEIEGLFRILRSMAAGGKTILIITHKLKEVMALASRVTVFRGGRTVAERKISETSLKEIASLMVGREISEESHQRATCTGEVMVEAREISCRSAESQLGQVSFRLRAGEILGVAGVEGNGQSELIRVLTNPAAEKGTGCLWFGGRDCSSASAARMRELGFAIFPEDRLREALLLGSSIEDNYLLGQQRRREFRRGLFLSRHRLREAAKAAVARYDVRPGVLEKSAGSLSGGNQQKLVVARELGQNPKFLLAAQPTRGVDIGAIEFIHGQILGLRDAGGAVLLISSELDEVLKLADRLLVMYRGRVVGSYIRGQFDEKKIGALMAGGSAEGGGTDEA